MIFFFKKNLSKSFIVHSIIFLVLALLLISCVNEDIQERTPKEPEAILDKYGFEFETLNVINGKVNKNETLTDILTKQNINYSLGAELFTKAKPIFDFRKIRPKKNYSIYFNTDSINSLRAFVYEIDKINFVKVQFEDSIQVDLIEREVTLKEKSLSGIINSSLYQTFIDNNSSPVLAGKLTEVFAWQIDFYTIAKGDKFKVVYEEKFVDDESVGIGNILISEFTHKNNSFKGILFEKNGKKEYFDKDGNSLQKEFLKAPLKYRRISSGYSNRRLHPILRVYKPHRGIDYAATVGTPVQAVGDGIVIKVGRNGAAGKMIKIRHNSVYTSAYLHLSGYAKGIKSGARVRQGEVIGYVGSTGRSTGPHLDFRFWKHGSLVNYLRQKFPSSKSVSEDVKGEFSQIKNVMMSKLNNI